MSILLDAALAAAARGWKVLPIFPALPDGTCGCGWAECKSIGKHPLRDLVGDGQTSATSDPELLRAWWTLYPDASVAVVMRPSGLIAFDIDLYHGDGEKLAALQSTLGDLPDTAEQISGSGQGAHLIYRAPNFAIRGQLGGIVLRGSNYIVIAPSLHKSGGRYTWERSPDEWPIVELPPAWLNAIEKPDPVGDVGMPSEEEEPDWLRAIPPERRVADMRAHLAKEPGEIMGVSRPGQTRDAIKTAVRAHAVRDPAAVLAAVLEILNPKNQPPYDEGAICDRIVFAYETAHTPEWGDNYEPRDSSIALLIGQAGLALRPVEVHEEPPEPDAPPEPMTTLKYRAEMEATIARLKRRVSATDKHDSKLLALWKVGSFIPDEDTFTLVCRAVAKHAPAGATHDQIINSCLPLGNPELVHALLNACFVANAAAAASAGDHTGYILNEQDEEVADTLQCTDKGPKANGWNIEQVLSGSSETADRIKFDELTKKISIVDGIFKDEPDGSLDVAVSNWLNGAWKMDTTDTKVGPQILRIARKFGSFNPVADYVTSTEWDRIPRIGGVGDYQSPGWLVTYCRAQTIDLDGTDIAEYVRDVGAKWLIGAAARALRPGCKMHTVLVLEGEQGDKKSTAFETLGGEWFTDSPIEIGSKDALMQAGSSWIAELAELASVIKSETQAQKAFLTSSTDKYRPPYGRSVVTFKRMCVFCGTVNPSRDGTVDYLSDDSGERRWWPVRVGGVGDVLALSADRDQLWAEAVHRLNSDERWWFEKSEQHVADKVTEQRHREDPWADIIINWARRAVAGLTGIGNSTRPRDRWTLAEVAKQALEIDAKDLRKQTKAVASALVAAGFNSKQERVGNDRPRMWSHPELSIPQTVPAHPN